MGVKREVRVEDVSVSDVWTKLQSDPGTVLIDVRSRSEWTFVGLPDLSTIGKSVLTIEWQTFPDNQIDPEFGNRLHSELQRSGAGEDTELFFICRSGGRSRMAAEVLAAQHGYRRCYNVAEGFEGGLDANRHRGKASGWKAAGLPWVQG
ncbi:MAG: rhodanese-like domain-containing protein [Alphaproteobacteria bacterium]|nr:rhodanese-like domain-containing protein [Alphaproteobacteria bacterium]